MPTDNIDFDMNFDDNQQSEADKRLLVAFYKSAIQNEFKTLEEGRPIFEDRDMIKIITPGSRDTFDTSVTEGDSYTTRFAAQWARYKAKMDQSVVGTPLSALTWLTHSQIAEYNALGCRTIEQLVGMSDSMANKFMGFHQIKQRAENFLAAARDAAPMLKMQAELEKRDEQIAELKQTVDALLAAQKAAKAQAPAKV